MSRKALLITNPNSRRGDSPELQRACETLREADIELLTATPKGAVEAEAEITRHRDSVDFVIVAGGDGMLNSMAGALHRQQLPLGILPTGTANDLARTLSIPDELQSACTILIDGHRQWIDLGEVNQYYYFNVAGIGLGTRITHELTSEIKKRWGVLGYLKSFLSVLVRLRGFGATLTIDGISHQMRSIHIAVGNGLYYGGGNMVDESARIDDGQLSLYSVRPLKIWKLLLLAPLLHFGKLRHARDVFTTHGKHIRVETSRPMEVHADGEQLTQTPAEFRVIHHGLQVFVPRPEYNGGTFEELASP